MGLKMNPSKSAKSVIRYPIQQEKIGQPDPLAPGYLGTYSPPSVYKIPSNYKVIMNHLVLLGDSIFDNAAYVGAGPAVIDQVRQRIASHWKASLLAVDGNTSAMVSQQVSRMPSDATHLVLSVGGNDALGCIASLETSASSVKHALVYLSKIKADFEVSYRALIATLLALNMPLMVCTIYDHVPGLPTELKAALSLFNDVILREAIQQGMPVLDLRMICTEPGDYSAVSPIEPSSSGGAKVVDRMVTAMMHHDFTKHECRVYV